MGRDRYGEAHGAFWVEAEVHDLSNLQIREAPGLRQRYAKLEPGSRLA